MKTTSKLDMPDNITRIFFELVWLHVLSKRSRICYRCDCSGSSVVNAVQGDYRVGCQPWFRILCAPTVADPMSGLDLTVSNEEIALSATQFEGASLLSSFLKFFM